MDFYLFVATGIAVGGWYFIPRHNEYTLPIILIAAVLWPLTLLYFILDAFGPQNH